MNRPIHKRVYKLALLWLLPLLLARAFIPAGFMLGAGADGFGLILCSGTMAMPMSMPMPMPAGHHHADSGHQADSEQGTHADDASTACPYAIGACAASIDVPYLAPVLVAAVRAAIQFLVVTGGGVATLRAHPIRGPPRFSFKH